MKEKKGILKRIRKKIINGIYKFKDFYKWYKVYDYKKYFELKNFFRNIILFLFIFIIVIIAIFYFIYAINNFQITNIFNSNLSFDYNPMDLLSIQISNTLIIISVISLLSSLSEKYLLGEKHINVIFPNKSLFSLIKIFVILLILLFINIVLVLKNEDKTMILLDFLCHFTFIIYICLKMLFFYTHKNYFRTSLMCKYLSDQRKHVRKAVPLNSHSCRSIIDLKNQTIVLIEKNDNNYNYNIHTIIELIDFTLFNDKKILQEYYAEMITRSDLITSLNEIIEELIMVDKHYEAINILVKLYSMFSYYEFVPVYDYYLLANVEKLIDKIKYIDKESLLKEYINSIWKIVSLKIYFIFLFKYKIDFSYCRLYEYNLIDMLFNRNSELEKIYICIIENKYLTKKEKYRILEDLYDNIRMMEHKEHFPDRNIKNFLNRENFNKEKIFIPYIIKGEPIIIMFLKMIENNDIKAIKIFRTMNLSKEFMNYIIMSVTLAIITIISKNNKREYVDDLEIKMEATNKLYKDTNFHRITLDCKELENMYKLFLENYRSKDKREYFLRPRLESTEYAINNYFYYLYNDIGKEEEFYKIKNAKGFIPDENLQKAIKNLGVSNKIFELL